MPRIFHIWVGDKPRPENLPGEVLAMPREIHSYGDGISAYVESCIQEKHWVALSDICRLIELFERGGIYLDCDCEIIDNERLAKLFCKQLVVAKEDKRYFCTAVMISPPKHPAVFDVICEYDGKIVGKNMYDGAHSGPTLLTDILMKRNMLGVKEVPRETFYPWHFTQNNDPERRSMIMPETLVAHHWAGSWL